MESKYYISISLPNVRYYNIVYTNVILFNDIKEVKFNLYLISLDSTVLFIDINLVRSNVLFVMKFVYSYMELALTKYFQ